MAKSMDERVKEIMDYLKTKDLLNTPLGAYHESEDWYYLVQAYNTKPVEMCRLESHEKYVDIQWLLKGEERIDITATAGLEVDEPYSDEKDVAFWKAPQDIMQIVLNEGCYTVLYPENAHRPGRMVNESCPVNKVVVKVKIDA